MLITPSGNPARLASLTQGQLDIRAITREGTCLGECKGREWSLRRGFYHRRAASSQSGTKLTGYHPRRKVPWGEDTTADAVMITNFVVGIRIQLTPHLGNAE